MNQTPLDPYGNRVPVIAVVKPLVDTIFPTFPPEYIHGTLMLLMYHTININLPEADHLSIPLLANLKVTDLVLESNHMRTAKRSEMQGFLTGELRGIAIGHGDVARHPDSVAGHLQNAGAVAAADVGAEADVDAVVDELAHLGAAAGQRRVAGRAVADLGVARLDQLALILAQVHRVR